MVGVYITVKLRMTRQPSRVATRELHVRGPKKHACATAHRHSHCTNVPYPCRGGHVTITIRRSGGGGRRWHRRRVGGGGRGVPSGATLCEAIVPRERPLSRTRLLGIASSRSHSLALLRATSTSGNAIW